MVGSWRRARVANAALAGLMAVGLTAASGQSTVAAPMTPEREGVRQLRGTVTVDGSSTVFPVTEAMAEEFQRANGSVRVTVGISGTGGGFQKFCNGETDFSNASRPISSREIEACGANGIQFVELPVAYDGLSVLVSPLNDFVQSITVSELKRMWEPAAQGTITRWSQISPNWPDRPFRLYGPGSDSGTFDYFTEVINGRARDSRGDYTGSEDDNILVQGIATDPDALGYFGYAYYVENQDRLKLVGVDAENGSGPVYPSEETIRNGSYTPLSRPIFIYAKLASLDRPEVDAFARFYLNATNATTLVPQVGYVAFPAEYYELATQRLDARQPGTVFGGQTKQGATLADLFGPAPR
ncbi:MAG: PstS family phosphate ABC transporter substrate-binding protein [Chloroflexi bacterium]|nr:PstS family phosphate ABC transporter substrate-binding protein [Chloroflexota bacterium]